MDAAPLKPVPTLPPVPELPWLPAPECAYNPPPEARPPPTPADRAKLPDVMLPELPRRDDITQSQLGLDVPEHGCSLGTSDQMEALGPQNYLLDLNPEVTFFRQDFKRHTAFAVQCHEDACVLRPGGTTVVELGRRGDVLGSVWLEVSLPDLGIAGGQWADAIGYVLMTRVRLVVDDVVLHDQERLWYDLVDKVHMPEGRRLAVDAMIGRGVTLPTDRAHTVVLPFKFMCCKDHYANQQCLPLVALATNARLRVEFTTEALSQCLVLPDGVAVPAGVQLAAKLLSDQMYVDVDERQALMRRPFWAMMETAQDADALTYQFDDSGTYDVAAVTVDLSEINLPVKSLLFVAYDETGPSRGEHFEYLDCVDSAVLYINSGERFAPRRGEYFRLVQPYQHGLRCTPDNVSLYSFALDASQRQPSGALNLAVVDRPVLRVEVKNADALPVKFKVFAHCINWIRIENGALTQVFT